LDRHRSEIGLLGAPAAALILHVQRTTKSTRWASTI
jgi:hypothetical protein